MGDAVAIGLGSTLGAGIFSARSPPRPRRRVRPFSSESSSRGSWRGATPQRPPQLAAQFPESGGTQRRPRACSANGRGSSPVGPLSWARSRAARRWRSPSPPMSRPPAGRNPWPLISVAVITLIASVGVQRTATATKVIVWRGARDADPRRHCRSGEWRHRLTTRDRRAPLIQTPTGCCSLPELCFSPSRGTRGSRRWARRCANRAARSPERS